MASPTLESRLSEIQKIETQANTSLLRPDAALDNAVTSSDAHNLPPITVAPQSGRFLELQCRLIGAKNVLEVGTLGGYSTIWFARSGAKVTSIEINPKHRDIALANTRGLDVDIILGAALDVLPKLAAEGRVFDFVFLDASWAEQFEYFQWAVKLTRPNGCIYVDNVVRNLLEDMRDQDQSQSLLAQVGRLDNVSASLISTVSSHKHNTEEMIDGFLLAVVNPAK